MAYGASERNIGKRCYLKNVQLEDCPFFPAPTPFKIIGANEETYLIEGPFTSQVRWTVKHRQVAIPLDQKEMAEDFLIPAQ